MACGLTRAARPTTRTLRPKNTMTRATPIRAPYSPLAPTNAALTATMTAAAAAVSAPARRTMMAYFASIYLAPEGSTATTRNRGGTPAFLAGAGRRAVQSVRYPVGFTKGITGLCSAEVGLLVKGITKSLTLSLPYCAQFMTKFGAPGPARPRVADGGAGPQLPPGSAPRRERRRPTG